jgi:nitroimidazol reductase NimA-like FMN-containing flavoprotein (pyridoxamine 5'-phosphate oxidase superfamily)
MIRIDILLEIFTTPEAHHSGHGNASSLQSPRFLKINGPNMAGLGKTDRTRIRRAPTRAVKETQALYDIIDQSYLCHVGFVDDGSPVVIPTLGWRVHDEVYIHGSRGSRMLNVIKDGGEVCLTFSLLDGFVMARSAFHHSANYRSAVVFGHPTLVDERQQKLDALKAFMDQIAPGRWSELRETND